MEAGAHIRRERRRASLPLRGLAEIVGVSPSYLSRVERGIVPASETLLRSIAEALGMDRDELLLLAGRLPSEWQEVISTTPARAAASFRAAVASCVGEPVTQYERSVLAFSGTRAIEDGSFPFEKLSKVAELESWRKELNRPIYHVHKWWARRLGSVFRAIVLGTFAPRGSDILEMFYQPARLAGAVVFDPFMGSGTTIGEALKLGARAIGRDINPVAHFLVRTALGTHDRSRVLDEFRAIESDVAPAIRRFYQARLPRGGRADVLYYFWVKVVACPTCDSPVDLFSSYVFAQHASRRRDRAAHVVCPHCGAIAPIHHGAQSATCRACGAAYSPRAGPVKGAKATCPQCGSGFAIAKAVRAEGTPPRHRLYAKLILRQDGSKEYLPANDYDRELYAQASRAFEQRERAYPVVAIEPGYNTNQVLNYCYSHWHQMFNARQLLCLGMLADRIKGIRDVRLRELFTCLFSGVLEFNNMFASYKGEGTGAVRHMFAHHILKPERTPLEANPWGTPKSSGAFSTLFESRILRAMQYREDPFELRVVKRRGKTTSQKVYGLSCPLGHDVAETYGEFRDGRQLYLSCGDSSRTDLASESVDAVVTDPPFFDNVHYSQLADFFYVWQRYILGPRDGRERPSTRSEAEVQQSDAATFTERLTGVWAECHRVLRPDGLLVFTYHHSRAEGWHCVLEAVVQAGFHIVAAHPIKAEMSVAKPKRQAKEPIDLDVIVVCRKGAASQERPRPLGDEIAQAADEARERISRLNSTGMLLSRNDVRVVLMAQVIKALSTSPSLEESLRLLRSEDQAIEQTIASIHGGQEVVEREEAEREAQKTFW